MKKIKTYISIIVIITIITIIVVKTQYLEQGIKSLIAVMECEACFSE